MPPSTSPSARPKKLSVAGLSMPGARVAGLLTGSSHTRDQVRSAYFCKKLQFFGRCRIPCVH